MRPRIQRGERVVARAAYGRESRGASSTSERGEKQSPFLNIGPSTAKIARAARAECVAKVALSSDERSNELVRDVLLDGRANGEANPCRQAVDAARDSYSIGDAIESIHELRGLGAWCTSPRPRRRRWS